MKIADYERAVLAALLQNPQVRNPVASELTEDKFGYGPGFERSDSHKLIYSSILDLLIEKKPFDLAAVERKLGDNIELAGGSVYLRSLLDVPDKLKLFVENADAVYSWVKVIDNAGRLAHTRLVLEKELKPFEDFEKLVQKTGDVDKLISNLVVEVRKAQGLVQHEYRPIFEGVQEFRRHLSKNIKGEVTSILDIGWPAFRQMGIPPKEGLMIISGLEGIGKTQLLLQILLGRAIQLKANNLPGCVALNSYEMPFWKLAKRLACCLAGVDGHRLALGQFDEDSDEIERINDALRFVETLPIYCDDSQMMTSDAINWQANALHSGPHGPLTDLGIDYGELVPDEAKTEERRVSRVYVNAGRLRSIGITAYVISQFNRGAQMTATKIGGKGRIRYSSMAQHVADVITELYNIPAMTEQAVEFDPPSEFDKEKAWLIVEKNRDGPTGAIPLNWHGPSTRFQDSSLSIKFGTRHLFENIEEVKEMVMGDF